jgi:hypothetical protein
MQSQNGKVIKHSSISEHCEKDMYETNVYSCGLFYLQYLMNAKYLISRWHLPKSKAIVILQNSEKYTRHY